MGVSWGGELHGSMPRVRVRVAVRVGIGIARCLMCCTNVNELLFVHQSRTIRICTHHVRKIICSAATGNATRKSKCAISHEQVQGVCRSQALPCNSWRGGGRRTIANGHISRKPHQHVTDEHTMHTLFPRTRQYSHHDRAHPAHACTCCGRPQKAPSLRLRGCVAMFANLPKNLPAPPPPLSNHSVAPINSPYAFRLRS